MRLHLQHEDANGADIVWLVLHLQDQHTARCRRLLRSLDAVPLVDENPYERRMRVATLEAALENAGA